MENMRMIRRKLRSDKGASLTFALLIFMVCAVVSSAVIVAATTAAGRMGTMDEMDERYYAVTDACEVLCDIFDGKTVNVTYTLKNDGSVDTATAVAENYILRYATEKLILGVSGNASILPEAFAEKQLTEPVVIAGKNCSLKETLNNGTLTFDVSAMGGKNDASIYRLSVNFASNVKYTYEGASDTEHKAIVKWVLRSLRKNRPSVKPADPPSP